MERKIGFAPIPRSGKERVLKVELPPHKPGGGNQFEPVIKVCRPLPYHLAMPPITGLAGFEPTSDGVKVRCLPLGYSPLI